MADTITLHSQQYAALLASQKPITVPASMREGMSYMTAYKRVLEADIVNGDTKFAEALTDAFLTVDLILEESEEPDGPTKWERLLGESII